MKTLFFLAKNQFIFELRSGRIVISTITIWLILFLSKIFLTEYNLMEAINISTINAGGKAFEMSWTAFLYLGTILLQMTSILSLPYEKNHNLVEINYTLPIRSDKYFGGKIIGLWSLVLLISIFMCTLYSILNYFLFNSVELYLLLDLLFLAGLPLLLWSSGIGFLAGAFIRSQQRAIIVGLILGLFSIPIWTTLYRDIPDPFMGMTFTQSILLTRQQAADFVFSKYGYLTDYLSNVSLGQYFSAIIFQIAIFMVLFIVVTFKTKLREGIA